MDITLALRAARFNAHVTLEQIGNVSDTLTIVLRFLSQRTPKDSLDRLAWAGAVEPPR